MANINKLQLSSFPQILFSNTVKEVLAQSTEAVYTGEAASASSAGSTTSISGILKNKGPLVRKLEQHLPSERVVNTRPSQIVLDGRKFTLFKEPKLTILAKEFKTSTGLTGSVLAMDADTKLLVTRVDKSGDTKGACRIFLPDGSKVKSSGYFTKTRTPSGETTSQLLLEGSAYIRTASGIKVKGTFKDGTFIEDKKQSKAAKQAMEAAALRVAGMAPPPPAPAPAPAPAPQDSDSDSGTGATARVFEEKLIPSGKPLRKLKKENGSPYNSSELSKLARRSKNACSLPLPNTANGCITRFNLKHSIYERGPVTKNPLIHLSSGNTTFEGEGVNGAPNGFGVLQKSISGYPFYVGCVASDFSLNGFCHLQLNEKVYIKGIFQNSQPQGTVILGIGEKLSEPTVVTYDEGTGFVGVPSPIRVKEPSGKPLSGLYICNGIGKNLEFVQITEGRDPWIFGPAGKLWLGSAEGQSWLKSSDGKRWSRQTGVQPQPQSQPQAGAQAQAQPQAGAQAQALPQEDPQRTGARRKVAPPAARRPSVSSSDSDTGQTGKKNRGRTTIL